MVPLAAQLVVGHAAPPSTFGVHLQNPETAQGPTTQGLETQHGP